MIDTQFEAGNHRGSRLKSNLLWSLLIFLTLALILFCLSASVLLCRFDQTLNARERQILVHGIEQRLDEINRLVVPTALGDAIAHLDYRFERAGRAAKFGEHLVRTDGFAHTFLLDRANHLIFASQRGGASTERSFAPFEQVTRRLLGRVRAAESRRGVAPLEAGNSATNPIQAASLVHSSSHLMMVTATLIQPHFGTSPPIHQSSRVVITVMEFDVPFLQQLRERFQVAGLRLVPAPFNTRTRQNIIALRDASGVPIGALAWDRRQPGMAVLRALLLPSFFVIAILVAAALLLIQRHQRLADILIEDEARMGRLAYFDATTGLPNRASGYRRIEAELTEMKRSPREAGGLAVCCIDLDRLNEVNEFFGQAAGDQLIEEAARRFAGVCGEEAFLARLSGDEFVAVQRGVAAEQSGLLAARLCEAFSGAVDLDAGRVFVSCSIGVAHASNSDISRPELVRQADLALKRAKKDGGDRFTTFEPEMDSSLRMRRMIEMDLRDAIATDALHMHYQPQVDGAGAIVGVEALIRWDHPERGPISPAVFVPIAEECGLIADLGILVFRHVFTDAAAWGHLKVAINVSAKQLGMSGFVDQLAALLLEYRADARNFELEITEGVLLREDPLVHDTLLAVRALGFSLALDDFGTGYSSLSYLRRYPIDKIKIDRAFVVNLGLDRQADAVVAAIVKLARALNLMVIAEGVETAEQRSRLRAVGCTEIQGFLFSKPISSGRLTEMLSTPPERSAA